MRSKTLLNFNRLFIITIIFLLIVFTINVSAQQINKSPVYPSSDYEISKHFNGKPGTEKSYSPDTSHSPSTAVIMSALVPGLGQIYNHKWYKVPFIYAGFSLLTVVIVYNYRHYQQDLIVYKYYYDPSKVKKGMPEYDYYEKLLKHNVMQTQVADAYNGYVRDFQLDILGVAGLWLLQMVDAYVDAKFIHSFSMDDNLSLKVSPGIINESAYATYYNTAFIPTLKITLSLY
ncbi:MAG TPA: DUF5683 domain-containing protein [Mucilaginibacter sp.]